MKTLLITLMFGVMVLALEGCVESPVTGLVCPPGMHPGPYGHRCFYD